MSIARHTPMNDRSRPGYSSYKKSRKGRLKHTAASRLTVGVYSSLLVKRTTRRYTAYSTMSSANSLMYAQG